MRNTLCATFIIAFLLQGYAIAGHKLTTSIDVKTNDNETQSEDEEDNCSDNHTYGTPSENYIEFFVGDKKRKLYFESIDIYKIEAKGHFEKGGYKIYLPPFGFSKELKELSEIHFTWKPEESFTEDQFNFPLSGLLRNDCFFEENRRELKKLFDTSDSFNDIPSEIKVDTLNTDKGFEMEVTSCSPENENVALKIHVVSKRIEKYGDVNKNNKAVLKDVLSKQRATKEHRIKRMYHYEKMGVLRIAQPARGKKHHSYFSLQNPEVIRLGEPDVYGFTLIDIKSLESVGLPEGLLVNRYAIPAEESYSKAENDTEIFQLPKVNIKPETKLYEYDLETRKPYSSEIINQIVTITSNPLILDNSSISKGSELPKTEIKPKYKPVYQNEIPEEQLIEVKNGNPHNTYIASDKGGLYKISSQKNKDTVISHFIKKNFLPTKYSINYKEMFKSEDEYLAYAEFLFAGEDITKAYLFSKENSEKQQKALNKINAAGLDSLISENKSNTLQNIRNFSRRLSSSRRDYIIYDYLTHFENKLDLLNAYIDAEAYLKKSNDLDPAKFDLQLKPVLDKYAIEYANNENKRELLKTAYDSLLTEYHNEMIRVARKKLNEDRNLLMIKESSENRRFSSVEKNVLGFEAKSIHNSDSLYLSAKGHEKSEHTTINVTENIWNIDQLLVNIPYLNLKQGFEKDIFTMNLNSGGYQRIDLKYNKLNLKVVGTEKLNVRGNKQEVMVIEMIPTDRINGLLGFNNFMIKENGTPYALIYVSKSSPHHLHSMKLRGKTIHFLKEGEYSLNKWLNEVQMR
ncbi:MAG: hypothetical protein ACQERC_04685 [Bacteroidota bacterium]